MKEMMKTPGEASGGGLKDGTQNLVGGGWRDGTESSVAGGRKGGMAIMAHLGMVVGDMMAVGRKAIQAISVGGEIITGERTATTIAEITGGATLSSIGVHTEGETRTAEGTVIATEIRMVIVEGMGWISATSPGIAIQMKEEA